MIDPHHRRAITLANWRTHPQSRWSFQHVSEFVPTAAVTAAAAEEPASPGSAPLEGLRIAGPDGASIGLMEYLQASHGDCFVAMREGAVIAEWNAPHCDPRRPHLIFSISKSITGMLAGIAAGDGLLDPEAPVASYVPTAPGSAYAEASVRHLLDMQVSLAFEEDYLDLEGPFDRYRRAMLWNPERPGTQPETMLDVLSVLPKDAHPHGERFFYASPDTDMMGLVLEAATGRRFHDYLAERLWKPMGARGQAYVTVDRVGAARAAGGVCVTARDLARFGQLMLDGGRSTSREQLVPADWVTDMRENGSREAWLAGNFKDDFVDGRYRSFWYQTGDGRGSFCAIGIHGQWLWCDPTSRLVLVKFSARPEPTDEASSRREIEILGQIARVL
jgi:CubicO group peptidase (beta-lactamase class C family)